MFWGCFCGMQKRTLCLFKQVGFYTGNKIEGSKHVRKPVKVQHCRKIDSKEA